MHEFAHAPRVSVVPPHPRYAGNALFEGRASIADQPIVGPHPHAPNVHWMDYCIAFREKARRLNITVATSDVLPIDEADALVVLRPPDPPNKTSLLRSRLPNLIMILVMLETTLGRDFMFSSLNTKDFDAVVTYKDEVVDNLKYFPLRPRAYYRNRIQTGLSFGQRRVGCFIASHQRLNRHIGLRAVRAGWRFTWRDWWNYVSYRGELLTYRVTVARHFISYAPNTFDLYGVGWDEDTETQKLCRGVPESGALHLAGNYRFYLAFENHQSETSLISERIWDGLYGDSVPVYRGNKRLARQIPQECFINADSFTNAKQMLDFLVSMKEDEWERYHNAGQEYIRGRKVERFLPDAAADDLLIPVLKMLRRKHGDMAA
jgi:hypothetical protein